MSRRRGRPPKQLDEQQQLLLERVGRDLGLDPVALATLREGRPISRDEARQMRRVRVAEWALDAYRTYWHLLREGPPAGPVYLSHHVEIPEEVAAIRPLARRRLPFETVARWAYRHRVLGESFVDIAERQVDYEPRVERIAELRSLVARARADGDQEELAYLEALLALASWQSGADAEVYATIESVRKAVERNRVIWELAERKYASR